MQCSVETATLQPVTADDQDILHRVLFFEKLNEEERRTLAAQIELVSHPAGHEIFAAGDPGEQLSTTPPETHEVAPVRAQAPVPHVVDVET